MELIDFVVGNKEWILRAVIKFIVRNQEWVLSVVAVTAGGAFAVVKFRHRKRGASRVQFRDTNNTGGVVVADAGNQVVVGARVTAVRAEEALLALRTMPGRLQDAIDRGDRRVAPDEARAAVEALFAAASAEGQDEVVKRLHEFQGRFNLYLRQLEAVARREVALADLNEYHRSEVVCWFSTHVCRSVR